MATSSSKAKATSKATPSKAPAKSAAKTAAKGTAKTKPIGKAQPKAPGKAPAKPAARPAAKTAAKPAAKVSKPAVKPAGKAPPKATGKRAAQVPPSRPAPRASHLPHIDAKTLSQIIGKLEDMREESHSIVSNHVQSDLKPREEAHDVGDDLDQASNERDREFNLIMHQRHLRRLQQIDEAFERIEEGTYGLCEGTDEPINPRRLLIMPLARYSLEYQEQQEKMLGRAMESDKFFEGEDSFSSEE